MRLETTGGSTNFWGIQPAARGNPCGGKGEVCLPVRLRGILVSQQNINFGDGQQ